MYNSNKIRLLILAPQLGTGGEETLLKDVFLNIDRDKFDVGLRVFDYGKDTIYPELAEAGLDVEVFEKSKISRIKFYWKMRQAICHFRPDVIVTWGRQGTVHGRIVSLLSGNLKVIPQVNSNMVLPTRISLAFLALRLMAFLDKFFARLDVGQIAISKSVRTDICNRLKIPEDRVSVVYCGVDTDKFVPQTPDIDLKRKLSINPEDKVVTIIARLAAVKNHRMFLRAARNVCKERSDVYFLVVGPEWPDDYGVSDAQGNKLKNVDVLKADAKEYGIEKNMRFMGACRNIKEILSITNIFAMTSFDEGLNNAVLEAMAAGKPVVATAVGGMCESIEDGKCGYYVESDDDMAMAQRILDLLSNPGKEKQFGISARQHAVKKFSIPTMLKSKELIFEKAALGQWSWMNLLRTGFAFKPFVNSQQNATDDM